MKTNEPVLIVVGPSGAGKSSFLDRALKDVSRLRDIITYSTRSLRPGESEGQPYHFVTRERFEELKGQNFFVEWANVHGNLYGTPWDQIRQAWQDGCGVIMDVDIQGAKSIKKIMPQAVCIFLMPPSMEALRQRLLKRGEQKDLDLRLRNAQIEMDQAKDCDHILLNDDFETAYTQFRKLIENLLGNQ